MKLSDTQKNILRFIGIRFASLLVRVLLKTVRIKIENGEAVKNLIEEKKNFISAFWHGSMLIGWYLCRRSNFGALVSKSKDGEVLSSILEKWKFNVVRGSSHIGGHDALLMMMHMIEEKYSLAITPDGPTGPIYKMKPGVVITSKRTQAPIVFAGIGIKNKITLKSWDNFEIPLPFSKCVVIYSKPILVDQDLSYDETSIKIIECEDLLNKLHKEAKSKC